MMSSWGELVDFYDTNRFHRRLWIKDEIYVSLLKDHLNGCSSVLDVGCGAGSISVPLSAWYTVYSLDFSRQMLDRLKLRAVGSNTEVNMMHADNQHIPIKDETVDVTFCKFALWPVPDPVKTMQEMVRVTKHNGKIIILEVNRQTQGYKLSLKSKLTYRAYRMIKRLIGEKDYDHIWKELRETTKDYPNINLKFTENVLEDCGCEIISVDTSIKQKINNHLARICSEGHDYFLIGAKK